MVAQLQYCNLVSGSLIPVDQNYQPIPTLTEKLAKQLPLTIKDMNSVTGFRQLMDFSIRRVGTGDKLYLALRLALYYEVQKLSQCELIDVYRSRVSIVNKTSLDIPGGMGSKLGRWKIAVSYAAIHEKELVPAYIPEILASLPYIFEETNQLSFDVVEADTVRPNGEWTRRHDADAMTERGSSRPGEI